MKHLIILERIWLPLGVMPPPKKLIHLLVIPMLSRSELVLHRFLPGVTPLTGQRRRRPEERMDVPTGFLSPTAYLAPASFLSTHDTSEQSPLCSGAFLCSRTKKCHPPAPLLLLSKPDPLGWAPVWYAALQAAFICLHLFYQHKTIPKALIFQGFGDFSLCIKELRQERHVFYF